MIRLQRLLPLLGKSFFVQGTRGLFLGSFVSHCTSLGKIEDCGPLMATLLTVSLTFPIPVEEKGWLLYHGLSIAISFISWISTSSLAVSTLAPER